MEDNRYIKGEKEALVIMNNDLIAVYHSKFNGFTGETEVSKTKFDICKYISKNNSIGDVLATYDSKKRKLIFSNKTYVSSNDKKNTYGVISKLKKHLGIVKDKENFIR